MTNGSFNLCSTSSTVDPFSSTTVPRVCHLGSNECNEQGGKHMASPETKQKGVAWQRRDGVPILGSPKVRRVLLAAVFPEFYTTDEVDALHSMLDEERTAKCHFFGDANVVPDRNRLMWHYRAGQFEEIRWAGSRSVDPFGLTPWWAGGIMLGLLNERPREYKRHIGPYMEVKTVTNLMTGMARVNEHK
ncbi:hypothetical protein BT69DRAFT_1285511 [Atractiella rhizophila]|nr:hypothetical protein BT69DRAFT_1285511 [Atractiella rhizophila]